MQHLSLTGHPGHTLLAHARLRAVELIDRHAAHQQHLLLYRRRKVFEKILIRRVGRVLQQLLNVLVLVAM